MSNLEYYFWIEIDLLTLFSAKLNISLMARGCSHYSSLNYQWHFFNKIVIITNKNSFSNLCIVVFFSASEFTGMHALYYYYAFTGGIVFLPSPHICICSSCIRVYRNFIQCVIVYAFTSFGYILGFFSTFILTHSLLIRVAL